MHNYMDVEFVKNVFIITGVEININNCISFHMNCFTIHYISPCDRKVDPDILV